MVARHLLGRLHKLIALAVFAVALTSVDAFPLLPAHAQGQAVLLGVLSRIPDVASSRTEINFRDWKAIEIAYPPARKPTSTEEFLRARAKESATTDQALALWWQVWANTSSDSELNRYAARANELQTSIGISIADLTHDLSFGTLPTQTLALFGSINTEAVVTALKTKGYTKDPRTDVSLWCGSKGCDAGAEMDPSKREVNPFGGNLGRNQPILVLPDALISSPDSTVTQANANALAGTTPTLAADPAYLAASEAVLSKGTLLQAMFWDIPVLEKELGQLPNDLLLLRSQNPDLVKERVKDYIELPKFNLLMVADVATDTEQIVYFALVYDNRADADIAAAAIPKRLATAVSEVTKKPWRDQLESRGITAITAEVVEITPVGSTSALPVVLIKFATPKATAEQILAFRNNPNASAGAVTRPGFVYRLFISATQRKDLSWLSYISREELENAFK